MKTKYPLRYIIESFRVVYSLFLYVSLFVLASAWTNNLSAQSPPLIEEISTCTQPITPVIICLDGVDPDGDNVVISEEGTHTLFHCSLTFLSDSCFQYIPLPGLTGTDTVYVEQCDDSMPSLCSISEVYVTIGCEAPIPENDNVQITSTSITVNGVTTPTNTALEGVIIGVTANDSDPCNDDLLVTEISSPPSNGTSTVVLGQVSYVPNEGFTGQDVLEYTVCNDCPKCATATVVINVTAATSCNEDFSVCLPMSDTVELCPEYCEIPLAEVVSIDASVPMGILNDNNSNCFVYTPDATSTYSTVATFIACNGVGLCDTTFVNIKVEPDCGTKPPTAMDDFATVTAGETVTVNVLNNDNEPDGQTLTVTNIITPPNCGTATINNNNIVYTAGNNCGTNQTIVYEVCDPTGLCATATVFVTVDEIVDCSFQDEYCVKPLQKIEICVTFCDLEGAGIVSVKPIFQCSIDILSDSCFTYIPLPGFFGSDNLEIIGCNSEGVCDTIYVKANIGCVQPIAEDDAGQVLSGEMVNIDILDNDYDPCGSELNPAIITQAANGTATINQNGTLNYNSNSGFEGTETITYIACNQCDDGPLCDTAKVVITVTPNGNETFPPIAVDDNVTTNIGESVLVSVLDNDSDADNDIVELTLTLTNQPSNGTVTMTDQNAFTYTPNEGFTGTDTFTYQICDPDGQCDEATVIIAVTDGTTLFPPVAVDDNVTTNEGETVLVFVLDNDSDADNDLTELTLTLTGNPSNGTILMAGSNAFTYTPNAGFTGTDTFTYQICDPDGQCDEATVTVTVNGDINPNDIVDAEPDLAYTMVNENVVIPVLANDLGSNIEITQLVTSPTSGMIVNINPANGTVTYMPNPNFVGTDYFTYQICNNVGVCDITLVTIVVQGNSTPNLPPNANNDVATTDLNTPINIDAVSNDTDPNNDPLTITDIIQDPSNGTVTIEENGTLTYTPNTDFVGCDAFAYNVCDGNGLCDIGLVSVTVGTEACVHSPIAADDEAVTFESTPIEISVLGNDTDPENEDADPNNNQILTASLLSNPANGIIVPIGSTGFTYIPDNGFVGLDYFMYAVCDDGIPMLCDTAYVTITVLPSGLNAEPDIVYTALNTPINISVLDNDSGTEIHVTDIVTNPSNGTITVTPGTDIITYTPANGFVGTDYFEYQICDDKGDCDVTIVTIIVLEDGITNLPPNAVNDIANTTLNTPIVIDVLENDNDPFGGNTISLVSTHSFTGGMLEANFLNGTVIYTPFETNEAYIDSFIYVICDNGVPVLCDTGLVIVTVSDISVIPINQTPIAVDDEATTDLGKPIEIPVLNNDFDPDGENGDLVIVLITEPIGGTADDSNNDGIVTYRPDPGFTETDFFTYIICDQGTPPLCDTAYVTITVTGDVAEIDTITQEETPVEICLEDYIDAFEIGTVLIVSQPDNGTAGMSENANCVVYDPDVDFTGNDSFTVDVCDPNSTCIPVNINIAVTPVPDPPIAVNDTVSTLINTPIVIEVLENDSDPDGDVITGVVIIDGPFVNGATATVDFGLLNVNYTPSTDFVGTDSFQYLITDPTGRTDTAWVFITIDSTSTNPPIEGEVVAMDDATTTTESVDVVIPVLENDFLPADSLVTSIDIRIVQPALSGTALEGDTSVLYMPDLDFVGIDSFRYELCVTFINDSVACDTALVVVNVESNNCLPKFANAFSPNNDGINDLFLIEGSEACFNEEFPSSLMIFNRWGDVVYQVDNYDNTAAWDGTWQESSKDVPDGTYFYVFSYQLFETETVVPRNKTGFVEVCR
ncbi:MAG: Ig-like domain-containing protein [Chitinophagales bacterium]